MTARVAIIGRPNVGKSTLFNRLVGKKLALVDDTPGVTRDRREADAQLFDLHFIIIDTAGLEEADAESLAGRMRSQTEFGLRQADVALLMVDARAGVTPLDRHFASWARAQGTPVILIANKAESGSAESGVMDSYGLGLGDPVALSAEHGEGLADLYQRLRVYVDEPVESSGDGDAEAGETDAALADGDDADADKTEADAEATLDDSPLKLAVVGRPNAGKSTLINRLIGEDRLVTGPEAGITRDAITIDWTWTDAQGRARPVRLIDTAGQRRRSKVVEKLERLSAADARRAVDFAEVVVLLLDSTLGLEAQDLRIADRVLAEGRALVVALGKWDLAADTSALFSGVRKALDEGLAQVKGVPLVSVSGVTGQGLDRLMQAAFTQRDLWSKRMSTARLNRWFEAVLERNPPPAPGGRRIKLRYITQKSARPPTFLVWGTRTDDLPDSYRRYLVNALRADLDIPGVPIRLQWRQSKNPYSER